MTGREQRGAHRAARPPTSASIQASNVHRFANQVRFKQRAGSIESPRALAKLSAARRGNGRMQVFDLLPERIRGLEITRMEFDPAGSMRGWPHVPGTKEYLHVIGGCVTVLVAGEAYEVSVGDVLAFPGDQPHSYANRHVDVAAALSVVVPLPAVV